MAMQYAEKGKLSFLAGQIAKVKIAQRSKIDNAQSFCPNSAEPLDISITSNGIPLNFGYTIDRDDDELFIFIPDTEYKAEINRNTFEGSVGNSSITQAIRGTGNSAIGKHTGGTIIRNHIGNLNL
jgi:hypothetical protein